MVDYTITGLEDQSQSSLVEDKIAQSTTPKTLAPYKNNQHRSGSKCNCFEDMIQSGTMLGILETGTMLGGPSDHVYMLARTYDRASSSTNKKISRSFTINKYRFWWIQHHFWNNDLTRFWLYTSSQCTTTWGGHPPIPRGHHNGFFRMCSGHVRISHQSRAKYPVGHH